MRRRLPVLAALAMLAACGGDDDAPPDAPLGPAAVSVTRYAYELDLTSRAMTSQLTLHVDQGGNCVTLPSRNTMLDRDTVTLGDAPATVTTTATAFTACSPTGWFAGADVVLTVHGTQVNGTWGSSQVGFSVTNDNTGKPMHYLVSWVGGCDRFGPCDTTPSVFAHYQFTIHHPAGTIALCPGHVTPGETTTTCVFDYDGGPTYSTFGLVASPAWAMTDLGTWGGTRVTLYDRPTSGMGALIVPAYHQAFLAWMVAKFGPFPYGDELRVVTGPTYWSGFEHPGNIVLDDGLARPGSSSYTRPVAHVLNHEMAHQWAGDQSTLADTYDFVWKESMAEYLSYAYEDETEPAVGLATAVAWKNFAVGAAYYPVPEDHPTLLDYYGEVYGPGPMILFRQLETLTSRAQVMDALKMLLGRPHALSVAEVQAALETTTGLDLDNYFDTWIRGSGAPTWPTFRVEITGAAPNQQVVVTETTPGGVLHGCNFAVELHGGSGEIAKVMIPRGVNGVAIATVPSGQTWAVTSTVLDPDAQCLAYPAASTLVAPPRHQPGWTPWRGSLTIQ